MIDILGNIKVDESKPERIKYLLACIRSYLFLKDDSRFYLNLENPSPFVHALVHEELKKCGYRYVLTTGNFPNYGSGYINLLYSLPPWENRNPEIDSFVINFMEDQFMLIDDLDLLMSLLDNMARRKVDICMCGFHRVEQNSVKGLEEYIVTPTGIIYDNTMENYTAFQRFYGSRYYIGVNFITSYRFARTFWSRDLGPRPHEYEICFYDKEWLRRIIIPSMEIQAAIDDDHGAEDSCLLKRKEIKWLKIIGEINSEFPDKLFGN